MITRMFGIPAAVYPAVLSTVPGAVHCAALCTVLSIVLAAGVVDGGEPLVVAHRGLLHHAPENTLASFRACLELRIGFEFDIGRTRDGHLVCIHDDTVDRTTDGTGKVSEMTLADIRALDAGSWFDPDFAGEKVPTVEEVLQLVAEYRQHDVLIAVDLKAENIGREVVILAAEHKVLERLLFIGRTIADTGLREQIKTASSQAQTAAVANSSEEFPTALAARNSDWVYFRFLPTHEQIELIERAGKRAFIAGATVSGHNPAQWRHCRDVGINAILTDYPLELRTARRQRRIRER